METQTRPSKGYCPPNCCLLGFLFLVPNSYQSMTYRYFPRKYVRLSLNNTLRKVLVSNLMVRPRVWGGRPTVGLKITRLSGPNAKSSHSHRCTNATVIGAPCFSIKGCKRTVMAHNKPKQQTKQCFRLSMTGNALRPQSLRLSNLVKMQSV